MKNFGSSRVFLEEETALTVELKSEVDCGQNCGMLDFGLPECKY